jgi:putative oxidoreductase
MKIVTLIARILLGLMFTVFGLNGFLQFLHLPMPTGLAGQYMGAIFGSHYAWMVFAFQLIGGLLLLVNRFVPLALTILAAVIVNILTFHVAMAPAGLPPALAATLLWFVVFSNVRSSFAPIFAARGTT